MTNTSLVLPRPGAASSGTVPRTIPAPSEGDFVSAFGSLLPQASYLQTPNGKAAYYEILPSLPAAEKTSISRILFVHGVQTPAIGLQPLAKALSSRFPLAHCVLVDLWGHGLTETPIAPHEPALFHGLLVALMDHLRWKSAHFVGYSFGGSTTATFAATYPELVLSMTLVAPAGLLRSSQFTDLERSYLQGGEGLEDGAREWILQFLEGGQLVVPVDWKQRFAQGEVVAEAVRHWQMEEHDGHAASVIAIFRDGGVLDKHAGFAEAAKKDIKTICILGELDDLCTVQDLHDIGMDHVSVVPQVGHGVVRQRVPEVSQLIEEFWNKL